jgi:hypothetical protein
MTRSFILAAVLVAGLVGYASAANLRAHTGPYQLSASGLVRRDGTIAGGEGFTVAHPQRTEYVVTFEPNYFGVGECASLVVEGINRLLLTRVVPNCGGSSASFDIYITEYGGAIREHAFMFVAVGLSPKN